MTSRRHGADTGAEDTVQPGEHKKPWGNWPPASFQVRFQVALVHELAGARTSPEIHLLHPATG